MVAIVLQSAAQARGEDNYTEIPLTSSPWNNTTIIMRDQTLVILYSSRLSFVRSIKVRASFSETPYSKASYKICGSKLCPALKLFT
jgi:hypothetical protein